jgi:hypothetical protein
MADITNKNIRVPGVNQDTNFIKQRSYCLNGSETPEVMSSGTHSIIAIPKGEAVTKLRVVALANTASGGSATLQFKVAVGGTVENINSSAVAIVNFAAGDVHDFPVNSIKSYDEANGAVIQLVVGSASLTSVKLLLVVETLPVAEFTKLG